MNNYWLDSPNRSASFENTFEMINVFSKEARSISKKYNHKILYSKILHSISSNNSEFLTRVTKDHIESLGFEYILDTILEYVDDFEVYESVYDSITESVKLDYLVYTYNEVDDSKKSRIRILSNMAWDMWISSRR